ncbi:MAG: SO2930 family diheme c-type cytochrome [Bacteroidia bacterium]
MIIKHTLLVLTATLMVVVVSSFTLTPSASVTKEKLSEYGFFVGKLNDLKPAEGVLPYSLTTPLFSDYTQKSRFVIIPKGKTITYNATETFDFPVGTVIIKNFYYNNNDAKLSEGKNIMETRLLIRNENGWEALPYFWNEEQTEATLEVAGGERNVTWKDIKGKKQTYHYSSPNSNQCKGCHNRNEVLLPIGPSARQLNGELAYSDGTTSNQLLKWKELGILTNLPADMATVPKLANWQDNTASLNDRARAYLDINCAHCHRKEGPASTSGFYLLYNETNATTWGMYKTPVAAGKGSGGRLFDIVPGNANASIITYRMESTDPGEMMPELGRYFIHKEGAQLIKDWINAMNPKDFEEYKK